MSEDVNEMLPDGVGSGIPDNWDAGDQTQAYPNGDYIFALGKLKAQYKDTQTDKSEPSSIALEVWVIKFIGSSDTPAQTRITIKDGKAMMSGTRGTKRIEFFPNPKFMPKMAWKASAFFSKFEGCIEEIVLASFDENGDPKKKKVVSWKTVQSKYGLVFQAGLKWTESKKDGKMYCNFDMKTFQASESKIPADDMKKIEELYDSLKKQDEAPATSAPTAEDALKDLPF
jgi:hypothetical protein